MSVDLLAMYADASREVFRLEAQRVYDVAQEAAQIRAFEETGTVPPDPDVEESMAVVRAAAASGTRVHRAHIVDLPLSRYLRYELVAYEENIAAGEQVNIAARSWHRDLAALTEDYVLFDPGTPRQAVVYMRYDAAGHLTGLDLSDDPAEVALARHRRDIALVHAVPLNEFTALAEAV